MDTTCRKTLDSLVSLLSKYTPHEDAEGWIVQIIAQAKFNVQVTCNTERCWNLKNPNSACIESGLHQSKMNEEDYQLSSIYTLLILNPYL